jgi:hypothetical protein
MSIVYIYVDGSDNEASEMLLVPAFTQLAESWSALGAFTVNQRHERTPDMRDDDLPGWEIGINISSEKFGPTQALELISFIKILAKRTDREFVVGVASSSGIGEDIVFLGVNAGEVEYRELLQHVVML